MLIEYEKKINWEIASCGLPLAASSLLLDKNVRLQQTNKYTFPSWKCQTSDPCKFEAPSSKLQDFWSDRYVLFFQFFSFFFVNFFSFVIPFYQVLIRTHKIQAGLGAWRFGSNLKLGSYVSVLKTESQAPKATRNTFFLHKKRAFFFDEKLKKISKNISKLQAPDFWGTNMTFPTRIFLHEVKTIYTSSFAFAAVTEDEMVVTWGDGYGGNVANKLANKTVICFW